MCWIFKILIQVRLQIHKYKTLKTQIIWLISDYLIISHRLMLVINNSFINNKLGKNNKIWILNHNNCNNNLYNKTNKKIKFNYLVQILKEKLKVLLNK